MNLSLADPRCVVQPLGPPAICPGATRDRASWAEQSFEVSISAMTTRYRQPAVLLIGPTGSGKTPLGNFLSDRGLAGQRCLHFDFGGQLRALVGRSPPDTSFSDAERQFLRDVLERGALLEDQHFALAARIFEMFLAEHRAGPSDIVVLNGLPRHVGQARAMEELVAIEAVVVLECGEDVVRARLASDVGGDRNDRPDDASALVREKLAWFERRTRPLIDFYRVLGRRIITLPVAATTTSELLGELLIRALDCNSSR